MLVGLNSQLNRIREFLDEWNAPIKPTKSLLLVGPPGVGKTSSVYIVAEEKGFSVCEYNASDELDKQFLEKLSRVLKRVPLKPTVFLFDEADRIGDMEALKQVLNRPSNPIILTANSIQALSPVLGFCETVRFFPPHISQISKLAGELEDYSMVSPDVRQAKLLKYGSSGYQSPTDKVREYFSTGNAGDDAPLLPILREGFSKLESSKLYVLIMKAVVADKAKRSEPL